ncbi:MAG: 50S ribosomal protein L13 [Candidatus Omnitrophica bacterium]|nr:50S ribosomal protein L13 [Candidatus Omnitrophota bacterium]
MNTKTFVLKEKDIQRKTHLVDAKGQILGRLATRVATLLMGKHKPEYTPFLDCGDQVIVINARDIRVSGRKTKQKTYTHYTGYPGGIRIETLETLMAEKPTEAVFEAIRKMLPHTKLGDKILRHLRVYPGAEHGQAAQKPVLLEIPQK